MKRLSTIFLFLLVLTACQKDRGKSDQPRQKIINASVITSRDAFGVLTGNPDPTDWTSHEVWAPLEEALLAFPDTIHAPDLERADSLHVNAFPNPVNGGAMSLQFSFSKGPVKLKFVIVNEWMEVMAREVLLLRPFPGWPGISLATIVNTANGYRSGFYRVYYAAYDNKGLAYIKGHGDFAVN